MKGFFTILSSLGCFPPLLFAARLGILGLYLSTWPFFPAPSLFLLGPVKTNKTPPLVSDARLEKEML